MREEVRARADSPAAERPGAARADRDGDVHVLAARGAASLSQGGPVNGDELSSLQRAAGNAAVASALEGLDGSLVHPVVRGAGQPLQQPVQTAMERQFGVDLSDVRVHTDSQASRSAEALNAQAYTSGSHIVFQRSTYQPGTDSGLRMLAHELTHVVQQRSGPVDGTPVGGGVQVSDPADRFEQAAERNATAVVQSIGGVAGLTHPDLEEHESSSS